MRKFLILLLVCFISSCSNSNKTHLNADEIFEKYLRTIGEKEKILSIKSYSHSTFYNIPDYGKMILNARIKIPDKIYLERIFPDSTKEIIIFNKDRGIIKSSNGITKISDEEIKAYKLMGVVFSEFYFQDLNYKIKLKGQKVFNGIKCYELMVNTDFGKLYYLIDTKSYKAYRTVYDNKQMEILERVRVEDVLLVKKTKSTWGKRGTVIKENYNQQFNVEINDSIYNIDY